MFEEAPDYGHLSPIVRRVQQLQAVLSDSRPAEETGSSTTSTVRSKDVSSLWQDNMTARPKVAFAEITTWKGISIGADHYYLKIVWHDNNWTYHSEEVDDILTAEHAKILNRRERSKAVDYRFKYKAGDKIRGFWTKELAEQAAIAWVEKNIPEYETILTGSSSATASVSRCIKHPNAKVMSKVNALYMKAERMGFYDDPKNDSTMEKIDKEFNRLIHGVIW